MNEKSNIIAQIITLALLLGIAFFYYSDIPETQKGIYNLAQGIGLALLISTITWGIKSRKLIKYWAYVHRPWDSYKPIRITVAYLFRIELDGQYLLLRNKRNIHGYQPIGGVYKYLKSENSKFFDEIGLRPDTKLPRDSIGEDDLRMNMSKRSKLLKFLNWFNEKENRELSPWREFYEELVESNLLDHKVFPHIQYRFIKQHTEFKYSKDHEIMEFKIADIYELQFINETQKKAIRELMNSNNDEILVATANEIEKRKKGSKQILEHTYKTI